MILPRASTHLNPALVLRHVAVCQLGAALGEFYVMSILLAAGLVLYAAAEYTLPRRTRLITVHRAVGPVRRRSFRSSSMLGDQHAPRRRLAASDFPLVVL